MERNLSTFGYEEAPFAPMKAIDIDNVVFVILDKIKTSPSIDKGIWDLGYFG